MADDAKMIDTTTMPGDTMDPDVIEAQAKNLNTAGTGVSTTGGTVLTTWQGLSASYHAPEQQTLFSAMDPVKTAAESFGTDMGKVKTALTTFASEVRTIKAAVAKLRTEAATLHGTVNADGDITETRYSRAGATTVHTNWQEDGDTVDANNDLIKRTNDQQEALWAAERKCANAINDIYGAAHVLPMKDADDKSGYGLTEIPDNADMPWGHTVERKEGCAESVFKGVVVDGLGGMLEGITSLVGFSWSGPDGMGFSWSTAGHAWEGLAKIATGLATMSIPGVVGAQFMPGPVGDWIRDSQFTVAATVAGLVSIDLYNKDPFHLWKDNPARAIGNAGFNVATFFVSELKVGNAARAGEASKLSRAGEAGRVLDAGEAGKIAKVSMKGVDIDGLKGLATKADLETSVKIDVKVDIPEVKVNPGTGETNLGQGSHVDAPGPRSVDPGNPTGNASTHPGTSSSTTPHIPSGQAVKPWETPHPTSAGAHTIDSAHPKVDFGTTKPTELGQIGEKLTKQDLVDRGYNVIGEQPQIRYTDPVTGADKWFKPDFVAVDPSGKVVLVESKMGDGAKFTPNQLDGYNYYSKGVDDLTGRSPNTNAALQQMLQRAGLSNAKVSAVEVYRWNTEIVPDQALRTAAGVP